MAISGNGWLGVAIGVYVSYVWLLVAMCGYL